MILSLFLLKCVFFILNGDTNTIFTIPAGKTVMATNYDSDAMDQVLYVFPQSEIQAYVDATCGTSSKQWFTDNDFQLHQPNTPSHGDSAFPVSTVEDAFKEKWENFISSKSTVASADELIFDAFFDHNFGLYVQDMTKNIERLQNQDDSGLDEYINYQFLKWELNDSIDDKTSFISLLVYIPNTQIIYELVSEYKHKIYEKYLTNELIIETEPRVTFEAYQAIGDDFYPWAQGYDVVPIRQGRAVSDIDINVAWYLTYLSAEVITQDTKTINGQEVKYAYLSLPYAIGFEIGFYERPVSDSFGDMSLKNYEDGINSVHKNLVVSYNCVYDRWFDNHYAIGMLSYNDYFKSIFNHIVDSNQRYVLFNFPKENADAIAVQGFETAGIDYIWFLNLIEPNGNTIEITGYIENDDLFENTNSFDSSFCPQCTDADLFDSEWTNNGDAMLQELQNLDSTVTPNNIHKSKSSKFNIPKLYALIASIIGAGFIGIIIYLRVIYTINQHKKNGIKKDELTPLMSTSLYGTV